MLIEIWNNLLYIPILNILVAFYHLLYDNMGLAIIAMTVFLKIITYPLSKPALELSKKQRELQPELNILKKKYKKADVLAKKQMELYRKHGINPAAGCLPQIVQLIVIFALYRVFTNLLETNGVNISEVNTSLYDFDFLKFAEGAVLNTEFLYLNLARPDQFYILPVIAAGAQFIMSKYMMKSTKKLEKTVEDTPDKKDDFMYNMQEQMMYMLPILTLVIGIALPSGLVLYWFISTILALGQYMIISRPNANPAKIEPASSTKK